MGNRSDTKSLLRSDWAILVALALIKLLVHFCVNAAGGYGYFRDELYYIACTEHLDIGYVDQPPLSIYILAVSRLLFGDSIFALRLLPAMAGAATVFLTGWMAREFGGGRFSQILAAVASIVSLIYLGMNTIFSMNSFDILFWTGSAYLIIRLLKTENPRYWLLLGLVLGLGLFNKIGVLWLAFGLFGGLLLTPQRAWLRAQWPWMSGLLALLVFLPYIIWNFTHDFAHLEFIRHATSDKYSSLSWVTFAVGQPLLQNPSTLPIWVTGLCMLFVSKQFKPFRLLGYVYVIAFLILAFNQHSKSEYLAPAYGMLFAAGAVGLEQWFSKRVWLKPVYLSLLQSAVLFSRLQFFRCFRWRRTSATQMHSVLHHQLRRTGNSISFRSSMRICLVGKKRRRLLHACFTDYRLKSNRSARSMQIITDAAEQLIFSERNMDFPNR